MMDCDFENESTTDGSTDAGSGSLSPTLTASPLWSPRHHDDVEEYHQDLYYHDLLSIPEYSMDPSCTLHYSFSCQASFQDHATHFAFPTCTSWSDESYDDDWHSLASLPLVRSSEPLLRASSAPRTLVSPAVTASPMWTPRDNLSTEVQSDSSKCVLCLSQFL